MELVRPAHGHLLTTLWQQLRCLRTMNNLLNRLAPAVVLGLPVLAFAQQTGEPTDAQAAARSPRYQSAFTDYKPWQDIKPGDWRQLNNNLQPRLGRAGGHAGHGTTAPSGTQAVPAPSPAPRASEAAMPAHRGHEMQGDKP